MGMQLFHLRRSSLAKRAAAAVFLPEFTCGLRRTMVLRLTLKSPLSVAEVRRHIRSKELKR